MYKKDEELIMLSILESLLSLEFSDSIDEDAAVGFMESIADDLHELSPECQKQIIEFGRNYAKKYSGEKKDSLENISSNAGLLP